MVGFIRFMDIICIIIYPKRLKGNSSIEVTPLSRWSYVSINLKLILTQLRCICRDGGNWGDAGRRVQASSYKMSKFWGSKPNIVTVVNDTGLHT